MVGGYEGTAFRGGWCGSLCVLVVSWANVAWMLALRAGSVAGADFHGFVVGEGGRCFWFELEQG